MAEYYVDLLNGSDSAAGTSEGAPWKRLRGMEGVSGTAASASYSASDVIYIRGACTAESSGTNFWTIDAPYVNGVTILPWPGHTNYRIDANRAYDRVVTVNRQCILDGLIAERSKNDVATSSGIRISTSASGAILRNCIARDNGRFGFYGNNVSSAANITLEDCQAYGNDTLPTDASGAGRFAAGFHMDGTGGVTFIRCIARHNGLNSNVGGDADGRGFSIVGGSDNCRLIGCVGYENGDTDGSISDVRNGSDLEGFNSDNVLVQGCYFYGSGAALEVKYSCDNWRVVGNVILGVSYVFQWGKFDGVGSTGLKAYNNTIALTRALQFGVAMGLSSGDADVRNNIFITARSDFPAVSIRDADSNIDLSTITFDYNLHYGCGTNHVYFQNTTLNQAYALAAYQALTGASSHSVNSLDNTDPPLDSSYRPTADSPCIGAGIYIPGAKHFGGVPTNAGSPDIGAHRYFEPRQIAESRTVRRVG